MKSDLVGIYVEYAARTEKAVLVHAAALGAGVWVAAPIWIVGAI